MWSFINDERGLTEPYADLPAMALAVSGFVIFVALMAQAYSAYEEKAFIAEHYQDARNLAMKLTRDPALTVDTRSDMIDAVKFDAVSRDGNATFDLMDRYGGHYGFIVKLEGGTYAGTIMNTTSSFGAAAAIPVTVKLNDVQSVPGTLTVKLWRKR